VSNTPFLIPRLARGFHASLALPGSKSIALRQLAMAALVEGDSLIVGIPPCDDTEAMIECLQALQVTTEQTPEGLRLTGPMNFNDDVALDARMSGASTRLLIGLAALRRGTTSLDGHPSLRARTNAPLLDVLSRHGCEVLSDRGCLPLKLRGPMTVDSSLTIDGALSSQYITALLIALAALPSATPRIVRIQNRLVSRPYVDITLSEMAKRGVSAQWLDESRLQVEPGAYRAGTYQVEGDATAATYFAALAALHGGHLTLTNLGSNTCQGDYGFFALMEAIGARVSKMPDTTVVEGPVELQGIEPTDMTDMPDAALTLMGLAPCLPGTTHIHGLSSLHHKECDRLECPATEFNKMGIAAATGPDDIRIPNTAPAAVRSHLLTTYHDHRMAMAFSILGSVTGNLSVDDPRVVDKTYPDYWRDFASLS
jgi:3-phosphoshikimate 1-carboxyvinyltransferase